jgi:HKD family nuclease
MFDNIFKHTPTGQEQQFIDIVNQLLEHPQTSLEMTPLTDKYFIINEPNHYYVLVKENGIQVTNTKFSFAKSLHPKSYNIIVDRIHTYMEAKSQALEEKLFVNETRMLNSVMTTLKAK